MRTPIGTGAVLDGHPQARCQQPAFARKSLHCAHAEKPVQNLASAHRAEPGKRWSARSRALEYRRVNSRWRFPAPKRCNRFAHMQAMVLERPGAPLKLVESSDPRPAIGEVRVRVAACGVCRTDLHVVDGELPNPKLPIVPGHEIVGRIEMVGDGVNALNVGQRVGVPWLGRTCGQCRYCRNGRENLCDRPLFTGYTRDGGYATHAVADARYVFALPEHEDDVATAPLLCAGLIGWRSLH